MTSLASKQSLITPNRSTTWPVSQVTKLGHSDFRRSDIDKQNVRIVINAGTNIASRLHQPEASCNVVQWFDDRATGLLVILGFDEYKRGAYKSGSSTLAFGGATPSTSTSAPTTIAVSLSSPSSS